MGSLVDVTIKNSHTIAWPYFSNRGAGQDYISRLIPSDGFISVTQLLSLRIEYMGRPLERKSLGEQDRIGQDLQEGCSKGL